MDVEAQGQTFTSLAEAAKANGWCERALTALEDA
jgi:hypothetical protein